MTQQTKWLPVFEKFIKLLRIDSKETEAIDSKGSPLKLWDSQRVFLEEICAGLDEGVRTFFCLKARQLGATTISLAIDVFWMAMHPATIGCLVSDTEGNREVFRSTIKRYIESFPKGFFGSSFTIVKDNRNFMQFSNGSRLDFLVAGTRNKKNWGEGKGYSFAHLCMAKGTPVVVEHGRIKNVEDVKIGDIVLTHTGQKTKVTDVFGQPGKGKRIIQIDPWMGEPIKYTEWHKIPTQRGLLEARDLKKDDFLVMPRRKITREITRVTLPVSGVRRGEYFVDRQGCFTSPMTEGALAKKQESWTTIPNPASGKVVLLNEEIGFFVGYYLAEGCMIYDRNENATGMTFARHRNEKAYSLRAIEAVNGLTTGHVKSFDRPDSLTSTETIYSAPLTRWVEEKFGSLDNKRIPDDVFTWGEDFCRGLVSGLLCGDGSKGITEAGTRRRPHKDTVSKNGKKLGVPRKEHDEKKRYNLNYIVMPSTRSSLVMQTRDLVCSLGYGWGSLKFKEGGVHYGRNCKPCWRVSWGGSAASKLREVMGLPLVARTGHDFTNKYIVEENRILIKIRSINECPDEEEVWDISVEHSDHTFRTPYMATSNTEVSAYGSEEGLASFRETLADTHPNRLFIYESTAKGHNHWKAMYEEAGRDKLTKRRFFLGWYHKNLNRIEQKDKRFAVYGAAPPDEEERELMALVKERHNFSVTMEQLAWYRWRASDSSTTQQNTHQNLPWYDAQSFILSGYSFFQVRTLQKELERIVDGVDENGEPLVPFRGYRLWLGNDFWASKMEPIVTMDRIQEVELRVWEEPDKEAQYVIGCDPALGRNDNKDRHAISCWRCFADKLVQVAEYADNNVETRQCAWVLAYLAGIYENCVINIELTGGHGRAVLTEFDHLRERLRAEVYENVIKERDWEDFLSGARHYLYKRADSYAAGHVKSFDTNGRSKTEIMNQIRDSHSQGILLINSAPLIGEMLTVVQDGYEIGAPGKGKDDRVFAMALANRAWIDSVRMPLTHQGLTYDSWLDGGKPKPKNAIVDDIVADFFRTAQEKSENPAVSPREQWMQERGFL